jgi:hypothetical protein
LILVRNKQEVRVRRGLGLMLGRDGGLLLVRLTHDMQAAIEQHDEYVKKVEHELFIRS